MPEEEFIGPLPLSSAQNDEHVSSIAEQMVRENFKKAKQIYVPQEKKHIHTPLPQEALDILQDMRVRLVGWSHGGQYTKTQQRKDFSTFRSLEEQETQWIRDLKNPIHNKGEKGEDGLTQKQRDALLHFEVHGGHAGVLSMEQLKYICQNGIILFLELQVREGVYATVGSIAALQETPFTRQGALYKATPNFDIRDSGLHSLKRKEECERADQRIVIWRTTVCEQMESALLKIDLPERLEGQSLRRMGLGATLKDVLFHFAKMCEKSLLTFNIGALYNTKDSTEDKKEKLASNMPSEKHNSWMQEWSGTVRQNYHDHILHTNTADVYMLWKAFSGRIDDGLNEFEKEGGLLKGKGIMDIVDLEQMADTVYKQIQWEKDQKIHRRNNKSWTVKT